MYEELITAAKKIRELCNSKGTGCEGCPFYVPETEDYCAGCSFDYDEPQGWIFPDEPQPW